MLLLLLVVVERRGQQQQLQQDLQEWEELRLAVLQRRLLVALAVVLVLACTSVLRCSLLLTSRCGWAGRTCTCSGGRQAHYCGVA